MYQQKERQPIYAGMQLLPHQRVFIIRDHLGTSVRKFAGIIPWPDRRLTDIELLNRTPNSRFVALFARTFGIDWQFFLHSPREGFIDWVKTLSQLPEPNTNTDVSNEPLLDIDLVLKDIYWDKLDRFKKLKTLESINPLPKRPIYMNSRTIYRPQNRRKKHE